MPQSREAEYIEYLERLLGKDFLYEIGFFHLDEAAQAGVIRQLVDLLGTRLGQIVSAALEGKADQSELEEMTRRGDTVFEIYDYLNAKVPEFHRQAMDMIELFKQDLRRNLAAM